MLAATTLTCEEDLLIEAAEKRARVAEVAEEDVRGRENGAHGRRAALLTLFAVNALLVGHVLIEKEKCCLDTRAYEVLCALSDVALGQIELGYQLQEAQCAAAGSDGSQKSVRF